MSEKDTVQEELQQAVNGNEPQQDSPKGKKKKEKVKKSVGREILEWVLTILVAVVAALVIRSFIFELVRVEGSSMEDTLQDQEIMLVSKFDYSSTWLSLPFQSNNAVERASRITFGTPKRLDVVICRYPARGGVNFVKRVVGLPGETVELRNGYLFIDGEQIEEESEIAGITDDTHDYREGARTMGGTYYVPKKGDTLTVAEDFSLQINGNKWDRRMTCLVAKDGNGKQLKIYTQNADENSRETDSRKIKTETVVSYNGKIWKAKEFLVEYPELAGQELTVDEDYYYVMGDHRNNSNDSRTVGALERSAIIGHVRRVVYPFGEWRGIE